MGFLATVKDEENVLLFPIGRKEEIIKIRGLSYIAAEVEKTVEKSCSSIIPNGVCLLELKSKLVLLVEIDKEANIFNSIPILLNCLLEEEFIYVDEIIFGPKGMIKKNNNSSGRNQRQKMKALVENGKLGGWMTFTCKNPYSQQQSQ